jgi:ABC-type uncharacterized transport system substrate-binding protein
MGFEDEVERSFGRPCRSVGRSKRTYELTSSIVPRGTSFHRVAELRFPPTSDLAGCSRCPATIPIVFFIGIDPVKFGFVTSLNRPGGNMTGIAALQDQLVAKRVELLHEMAPKAAVIALLVNPINRYTETETRVLRDGAHSLGLELRVVGASTSSEIDAAFGTLAERPPDALLISADLFLLSRHKQLVALITQYALPAMCPLR